MRDNSSREQASLALFFRKRPSFPLAKVSGWRWAEQLWLNLLGPPKRADKAPIMLRHHDIVCSQELLLHVRIHGLVALLRRHAHRLWIRRIDKLATTGCALGAGTGKGISVNSASTAETRLSPGSTNQGIKSSWLICAQSNSTHRSCRVNTTATARMPRKPDTSCLTSLLSFRFGGCLHRKWRPENTTQYNWRFGEQRTNSREQIDRWVLESCFHAMCNLEPRKPCQVSFTKSHNYPLLHTEKKHQCHGGDETCVTSQDTEDWGLTVTSAQSSPACPANLSSTT